MGVQISQLRQVDLNLLVVLVAIAEEKNISAAAKRLRLSQPAVSRALQRLREMFGDELLIRHRSGYELTAHAQRIQSELAVLLPQLDLLIRGEPFDPNAEPTTFHVMANDYALYVLGPKMGSHILQRENKISLDFCPWHERVYDEIEKGHVDLTFHSDDLAVSHDLRSEVLYKERLACIVSKKSRYRSRISLKQYAEAEHVVISLLASQQPSPDRMLAKLGVTRKTRMRIPYFAAALDAIDGTDLIVTLPRRFAEHNGLRPNLKLIEAPPELKAFHYLMVWHPRLDTDAANEWLRAQVRMIAKDI